MRLDKFLKVSRIIKRRTIAKEICDAGKVLVNEKAARASYDVKVGDKVEVQFGDKKTLFEIIKVCEYIKKDNAESLFKIIENS